MKIEKKNPSKIRECLKIGHSQVPQILCGIVGAVFMLAYIFMDMQGYAIITLICLQASCVMTACYDEREDEKKANAEALGLLDTPHKSWEVKSHDKS